MTRAERLAELRRYCELFSGGANVDVIVWLLSQLALAEKVVEAARKEHGAFSRERDHFDDERHNDCQACGMRDALEAYDAAAGGD